MLFLSRLLVLSIIFVTACGSDSGDAVTRDQGGQSADVEPSLVLSDGMPMDDTAVATSGGRTTESDEGALPMMPATMSMMLGPKYVETSLSPRQPLYSLGDTAEVAYRVQDKYARVLEAFPVTIKVFPEGIGQVDDAGTLSFNREGAGFVRVCAAVELCGRVNFFVDDGPPKLEVISPARGAQVSGEPTIPVEGRTDGGSSTRVFVNDVEVAVADDGHFATTVEARFGLNRIDIVADDGVRRPSVRWVSEVLWAPRFVAPEPQETQLGPILTLRVDNQLFDGGQAPEPIGADGVLVVHDLASIIEALLARVDFSRLIDEPQLVSDDELTFRVIGLEAGRPDVSVLMTDEGFELFFRIEAASGRFTGQGDFAGEQVVLDGEIDISVAAFARVDAMLDADLNLRLSVADVGVAIERLTARMENELAQAAVESAASLVRVVLNEFGSTLFESLISEQLTDVIELGLDEVLEPLTDISLSMTARAPLPAFDLKLASRPLPPQWVSRGHFDISLDGAVRAGGAFEAPYPSPGIPDLEADLEPLWPARTPLVLALRLLAINGALEALWRQRLLQLDLSSSVPPGLFGIEGVRIDGRLPPVVVPTMGGGSNLMMLQIGAVDLLVDTDDRETAARYVMSIRVGLGLSIEDGVVRSVADEAVDVRIQYLPSDGEEPPIPIELILPLIQGELGQQLVDSVSDALTVTLPAISIGEDVLGEWIPSVSNVDVVPSWPQEVQIRRGWIMLPADAQFKLNGASPMP